MMRWGVNGLAVAAVVVIAAGGCGTDRLQGPGTGGRAGGMDSISTGGTVGPVPTGGFVGTVATGGVPGTGGVAPAPGVLLLPSSTGFVDDPASGVVGSWYPFGDGIGPNPTPTDVDSADSDCVKHGGFPPSDCSIIQTPTAGRPFAPSSDTGAMCTSGVAAMVLVDANGSPDYADLWGAGIGLDLNNPGGDASAKGPWDGSAFTGIAFDVSGPALPIAAIRVLFPFIGQHGGDAPYFQGQTLSYSPVVNNSHVEIHWSDVGGPLYLGYSVPPVTPPLFDPSKLLSIQFQVFTNTSTATPFGFCVSNLTLLSATN